MVKALFTCLLASLFLNVFAADDWAQFRGPNRDGIAPQQDLLREWPETGPQELWRKSIGAGFSAISVVGDRLYTMDSDAEKEYALCLDAKTGETLWRVPVGSLFTNNFGNGPRATPTVEGDRVYILSSMGNLMALKADSGETIWSRDFQKEFESKLPIWAFCASALIVGDQLITETGGTGARAIASFNKNTGELNWTAVEDEIAYSSPQLISFQGTNFIAVLTKSHLVGLDLNGKELWRTEFVPDIGITPAIPVFVKPDLIFVSASYDGGAKAVQLVKEGGALGVKDVWQSRVMRNHFNASVSKGDYLYGFDKGMFKSINARSGEQQWVQRGLGKGSLILAGDHYIALSERGRLVLGEATPEAYRELASHQVLRGRCWTQPTLHEGDLYVRNATEIVGLRVAKGN